MLAYVVHGPHRGSVDEVDDPVAGPGQAVVVVSRVGVCGTDAEFFAGEMAYLHQGHAAYPLRLGHEWCGTVVSVGDDRDAAWTGRRVTGDTMLGCGSCARCLAGRQHVCEQRFEIGIRGGWPGALAERLVVPVAALHELPDSIDDAAGAMVEPGGNALRAAEAAHSGPGTHVVVWGSGTIGILAALFARARGAHVTVVGIDPATLSLASSLGLVAQQEAPVDVDAIIDATNDASIPARALDHVTPGGRLVLIGLSGTPSLIDTRMLALKDVTAVGILSASPGIAGSIAAYADGTVDPRPLIAATVPLERAGDVLGGWRPGDRPGPKIHVDPRRADV